jgi:hypothetical protein
MSTAPDRRASLMAGAVEDGPHHIKKCIGNWRAKPPAHAFNSANSAHNVRQTRRQIDAGAPPARLLPPTVVGKA